MIRYGILIYEQVAELDFVGPQQVFAASEYLNGNAPHIPTIAETRAILRGIAGLAIQPDYDFASAPEFDILLIPGTAEAIAFALGNSRLIDFVRDRAPQLQFTAGVCTGALIMQKAGLLQGKRATTHWQLVDQLAEDPEVTVQGEMRYVRDGAVITSQGVSAGIDMALWLVGHLHSPEHANQVRRVLQYDPAPPYTASV